MTIGENIKYWREKRNLKQAELAELIGVSDKTVSSWEINRTEPKMGVIEKICTALKCRKTDIIGPDKELYSPEYAILHAHMTEDLQYTELYKVWIKLNDIGKQKLMDNAADLVQIYNK